MPYQGRQPGVGVRNRFIFTATSGQTSFSGADSNGLTLKYPDATYTDVFLNGALLIPATDYAATTGTSIVLSSGAATSDVLEVVAYDISSIANAVPTSGGTFNGPVTVQGNFTADGGTIKLDGNYPVGTGNVALGDTALDSVEAGGTYNVAIGASAGTAITTGDQNTILGYGAGVALTTGLRNTLLGSTAGDALVGAERNTAVGYGALHTETEGDRSTAVGVFALSTQNTTGGGNIYNTAVGYGAGNVITTGANNTLIGGLAGDAITTGASNSALGSGAMTSNTTGAFNTGIGDSALYSNTTASESTMVGYQAGYTSNANKNQFFGHGAGYHVASGAKNVILGCYNGNAGGLDIRTSSNNIVLSDGDGNVRAHCDSSGNWTGIGGGGKVLQVVNALDTTSRSGGAAAEVLAVTASITPSATSSKIVMFGSSALQYEGGGEIRMYREYGNAGQVQLGEDQYYQGGNNNDKKLYPFHFYDSPNTTSATSYTIVFEAGGTHYTNYSNSQSVMFLMEIDNA